MPKRAHRRRCDRARTRIDASYPRSQIDQQRVVPNPSPCAAVYAVKISRVKTPNPLEEGSRAWIPVKHQPRQDLSWKRTFHPGRVDDISTWRAIACFYGG